MAEESQNKDSLRLTPVDQLPDEVRAFIKGENEAVQAERQRREARQRLSGSEHARHVREQMNRVWSTDWAS